MRDNPALTPSNGDAVVSPFPGREHDHGRCVSEALSEAERLCAERGRRLTAIRRRVLELVWESHQPVKAYDLLARLRHEYGSAAPPTVYRALDFLLAEHLIHRLASLNAYVGCARPADRHAGQFLICRACGTVAELDDAEVSALLARRAAAMGFALGDQIIELEGLCPRCRETGHE